MTSKLAHAGGERDLRFLAGRQQAHVEASQDRIAAGCAQGAHIEYRTNLGAPTPNRPCPAQLAAVTVERRYSYQRGDLSSVQCAELRQMGQKE